MQPARLLCPWDSPGKNIGVGCYALHQGIFSTQGSNLHLLHCRQIVLFIFKFILLIFFVRQIGLPLSHHGSPVCLLNWPFAIRQNSVVVRSNFFLWPNCYPRVPLEYKSALSPSAWKRPMALAPSCLMMSRCGLRHCTAFSVTELTGAPSLTGALGLEQVTPLCALLLLCSRVGAGRAYQPVHRKHELTPIFLKQSIL